MKAGLVLAIAALFIISGIASAADCKIKASCAAGENEILKASGVSNAHAATVADGADYSYSLCCADFQLQSPAGTEGSLIARLNRPANAHAESPAAEPAYTEEIKIVPKTDLSGFGCVVVEGSCPSGSSGVLSFYKRPDYKTSNSHIADFADPDYKEKVCCGAGLVVESCSISPTGAQTVYTGGKTLPFTGQCLNDAGTQIPCSLNWSLDDPDNVGGISPVSGASTTFTSTDNEGQAVLSANYNLLDCGSAQITVVKESPPIASGRFEIKEVTLDRYYVRSDDLQDITATVVVRNGLGQKNARVELTIEGPGVSKPVSIPATIPENTDQRVVQKIMGNDATAWENFQESQSYSVTAKLYEIRPDGEFLRDIKTTYFVFGKQQSNVPEAEPLLVLLVLGIVLGIAFSKRRK